jgi:hypothetical protein
LKDFSIEILEMYSTSTLIQQNKKLKNDVDFPGSGTSSKIVMSKMQKLTSRNAKIPGSPWPHPS